VLAKKDGHDQLPSSRFGRRSCSVFYGGRRLNA
jgi:hypothetical protein